MSPFEYCVTLSPHAAEEDEQRPFFCSFLFSIYSYYIMSVSAGHVYEYIVDPRLSSCHSKTRCATADGVHGQRRHTRRDGYRMKI